MTQEVINNALQALYLGDGQPSTQRKESPGNMQGRRVATICFGSLAIIASTAAAVAAFIFASPVIAGACATTALTGTLISTILASSLKVPFSLINLVKRLTEKVKTLFQANNALNQQIEELRNQPINHEDEVAKQKIAQLNQQIDALKVEIRTSNEETHQSRERLHYAQEAIAKAEEQIGELNQQIDEIKAKMGIKMEETQALQQQLEETKKIVADKEKEIEEVKNSSNSESNLKVAQTALNELHATQKAKTEIEKKLSETQKEIEKMKKKLTKADYEKRAVEVRLKETKSKLDIAQDSLAKKEQEIGLLRKNLDNTMKLSKHQVEEIQSLKVRQEELEKRLSENPSSDENVTPALTSSATVAEHLSANTSAENPVYVAKIEKLTEELQALKTAIQDKEHEVEEVRSKAKAYIHEVKEGTQNFIDKLRNKIYHLMERNSSKEEILVAIDKMVNAIK
ncbi:hypothetical protein NEOC84_001466|uniref:hypothetical protein n=1 Tax=Neochlamydia sp. AcF84 TaxID=2315858 RepID=UPI0014079357|nr:hypothetical protein [Neochlamydia sp. AcF84]NGY95545.1 hypothetical protein [Neochlamydia sp. AcF84]